MARDAKAFLDAIKNKEFKNFLENPFVPKAARLANITPLLNKLGFCKVSLGCAAARGRVGACRRRAAARRVARASRAARRRRALRVFRAAAAAAIDRD